MYRRPLPLIIEQMALRERAKQLSRTQTKSVLQYSRLVDVQV